MMFLYRNKYYYPEGKQKLKTHVEEKSMKNTNNGSKAHAIKAFVFKHHMTSLLEQTALISFKKDMVYNNTIKHVVHKVTLQGVHSYATVNLINILDIVSIEDNTNTSVKIEVYDNDDGDDKLVYTAIIDNGLYTIVVDRTSDISPNSATAEYIREIERVLTEGTYPFTKRVN